MPTLADRGEQEWIEFAPDARRQRGVCHAFNPFCLAPKLEGACATSESSARDEETNRLPGALRLDSETTRFIVTLGDQVARAICSAQKLIATSTDIPRKPSAAPTKLPTTGMI